MKGSERIGADACMSMVRGAYNGSETGIRTQPVSTTFSFISNIRFMYFGPNMISQHLCIGSGTVLFLSPEWFALWAIAKRLNNEQSSAYRWRRKKGFLMSSGTSWGRKEFLNEKSTYGITSNLKKIGKQRLDMISGQCHL